MHVLAIDTSQHKHTLPRPLSVKIPTPVGAHGSPEHFAPLLPAALLRNLNRPFLSKCSARLRSASPPPSRQRSRSPPSRFCRALRSPHLRTIESSALPCEDFPAHRGVFLVGSVVEGPATALAAQLPLIPCCPVRFHVTRGYRVSAFESTQGHCGPRVVVHGPNRKPTFGRAQGRLMMISDTPHLARLFPLPISLHRGSSVLVRLAGKRRDLVRASLQSFLALHLI
jgi:hypothetical protein